MLAVAVANPTLTLGETPPPPAATPPPPPVAPPATAPAPSANPPATAAQAPGQPVFSVEQLDQMTAPIALYPDELLAQILIAATYPLEVVQAERWAAKPDNAKLKGDQLAAALEPQTWDPSVKSLVPYPQVLKLMSDQLDWTQRLGDAFLAQQADVMASVQRLRMRAQDAGTLKTTEQQTVVVQPAPSGSSTQRQTIVIQPTNPQVVYVPTYNSTTVYGTWPYPAYPPPYYPPYPAYYPGYYPGAALATGLAFGVGVASIAALSGCCHSNWGGGSVNINSNRYNTINSANIRSGRATAASSNTWRHDSSHRGGVAYRDAGSRQAYQRGGTRPAAATRDFRGYSGAQRGAAAGQRTTGQGASRAPGTAANRAPGQSGGAAGARQPSAGARASTRQPAAFQGVGNGAQARAQSDRGRSSMQSLQSRSGGFSGGTRAGGGAARAGGGGGGARGGGRR